MRTAAIQSLILFFLSLGLSGLNSAQSAFRCEQDGRIVYSDKPCPGGAVVAPTQDTPEQKQRAREARAEMKQDSAELARRIREREAAERKAQRARAREAALVARAEKTKLAQEKSSKKRKPASQRATAAKKSAATGKAKGKKKEARRDPILAPPRP